MRLVAAEAAERLGLRVVDEEIVMRAAAESGVGDEIVADVERRRTFLDRALGAFVVSDPAAFPGGSKRRETPEQYDLVLSAGRLSASGVAAIVGHATGG